MISVNGQYVFDVWVGKYKNFLNWDDLVEFTLIEDSGCVLPVADLTFKFKNEDIRNYIVQNNTVIITFGSSIDDMRTLPFTVFEQKVEKHGGGYWLATIHLIHASLGFIQGTHTRSYTGVSNNVISSALIFNDTYLALDTNVTTDRSIQKWLQCKETTRDFVTNVWLHANLPDSFPAVAITKDSKFKFRDMMLDMKSDPKWVFSYNKPSTPQDIQVSGSPEVLNDTGTVNTLTQGKTSIIHNSDEGTKNSTNFTKKTVLANTNNLEQINTGDMASTNYTTNSNVHSSYWDSYNHNISMLTYFSGVRVILSFIGTLKDNMEVLDIANFLDRSRNNSAETEGLYSGKYIITKLVRTIDASKNLQTHVILSRESLNEIKDYEKEISQTPEVLETDKDYIKARAKLSEVLNKIKALLALKDMRLTIPSIRVILDNIMGNLTGHSGFNLTSLWMKLTYILGLSDNELLQRVLALIFKFLCVLQQCISLAQDSDIMNNLNSESLSGYIADGYITIPNVGSSQITSDEYTSNIFAWYVDGTIDSNTKTGDSNLDKLIQDSIKYIENEAIIGYKETSLFKRYWGGLVTEDIENYQISSLYREESKSTQFNKKVNIKNNYLYFIYPEFVGECNFKIDGVPYTNLKMSIKYFKINNEVKPYLVYRTKDKFNKNIDLEIS